MIVEVKDWNLDSYLVDETNHWKLRSNQHRLMSPFQQAFGYKKRLFDLHIDGLAEAKLVNRNFYNILKPFVYFHDSSKQDVHGIFAAAEHKIKNDRDELNSKIQQGLIDYNSYEKRMNFLELKAKQINRDRGIAVSAFTLKKLHRALSPNPLFTDAIYDKFKRHLQPPYHVLEQGKVIKYGVKQLRLTESSEGFSKIKGVAGSGKTTVLAKRAVNAHKRHNESVLILTFNLTLKNYIHDKISNVRESFSWGAFDITNYHSFIMDQRYSVGCPADESMDFESQFSDENMFDGYEDKIGKYKTILIDEIQDFDRAWIDIIRKYFLESNGEMVLFGDEGQNIYDRPVYRKNDEIGRGFGRWEKLTKSYRSKDDAPLTEIISDFQVNYLLNKYDIDKTDALGASLSLDLLQYHYWDAASDWVNVAKQIFDFVRESGMHPNDFCIIGGEIAALRQIERAYKTTTGEGTSTTFESQEAYEMQVLDVEETFKRSKAEFREKYPGKTDKDIKDIVLDERLEIIRRSKKYNFWLNSGNLKLSTVHSFKGLEAQNIIYILSSRDTDEIVYTGITRSRRNLLLFLATGARHCGFFEERLSPRSQVIQ